MNINNVMKKVFLWMAIGLLITFATGYYVASNENMVYNIFTNGLHFVLAIVELVLVIVLSARINKMNPTTVKFLFAIYSFVTGLTFSVYFVIYELSSIIFVFLITAIVFGIFSLIGYTTKVDLTKLGTYLLVGLIGILICTIVNIFLGNGMFEIIICSISVIIFLGFTAYDVQKIKRLTNFYQNEDSLAIIGALELYLDFINIFIDLLRLFGKSRD